MSRIGKLVVRPGMGTLRRLLPGLLLIVLLVVGTAAPALACPVCYGKASGPVIRGTELSVLFMVILTYLLLGGGLVGVFILRRQLARRSQPSPLPSSSYLAGPPALRRDEMEPSA